jgi:hypothetical protein
VTWIGFAAPQTGQQTICGQRTQVVQQLQTHYGKTARSIGIAANNSLVEVFASDETGTSTITVIPLTGAHVWSHRVDPTKI